ncbi:MAG: hypothetical protein H7Y01_09730, partial [Ferruginibacter sp.]|nr:hypothetical protein [Chitinophagaceae bacterium]
KEKTKGLPVVFSNSYQRASKYWFYSGQVTYSQNLYKERRNNYNFWPIEDSLLGKPVFLLDKYDLWRFEDSLKTPLGWIGYKYDPVFSSFAKVQIRTLARTYSIQENEELMLKVNYLMPPLYHVFIKNNPVLNDTTVIAVFNKAGWIKDIPTQLRLSAMNESQEVEVRCNTGLVKGKYFLRFAIRSGYYYPTHNSDKIELVVK